jgi:hypothetical protein
MNKWIMSSYYKWNFCYSRVVLVLTELRVELLVRVQLFVSHLDYPNLKKIANLGLQTLRFATLPFLTSTLQKWVLKHCPLANHTIRLRLADGGYYSRETGSTGGSGDSTSTTQSTRVVQSKVRVNPCFF